MPEDLTNALKFLSEQALKANTPAILACDAEPNHIYLICKGDGNVQKVTVEPDARGHHVSDISSLVAALELEGNVRTIWYSREQVVGLFDNATRRDTVKLAVGLSPQIKDLQQLDSAKQPINQRDLVLKLRTTYFGCVDPGIIAIFRNVKFQMMVEQSRASKESLGQSIKSQLEAVNPIPDEFEVNVPAFANPGVQSYVKIMLSVDVSPEQGTFTIRPLPLSIEQALMTAENELGQKIVAACKDKKDFVVLMGRPE